MYFSSSSDSVWNLIVNDSRVSCLVVDNDCDDDSNRYADETDWL